MARRPRDTEVDAYIFIKQNLQALGWDSRNPERVSGGQLWTQNECLSNEELRRHLGTSRPENIVKITDSVLWVIEAKRSHGELARALSEAEEYARRLNNSKNLCAMFISGVAGNDVDTFMVRSRFLVGDKFVPIRINGMEVSGLLSPDDCRMILSANSPDIENPPINEKLFLDRATHINEILHLGAVNPHQRANIMAALLLSMLSYTGPNVNEHSPSVFIEDINGRVRSVLQQQGKSEFYDLIRICLPSTQDNHVKFRQALVATIQELNNLNIRSAMKSGVDWLGAFYEVFLKYANWAQDLGIVLTPRHITRYVAEVMDIQVNDIVYDPTCGTGGFLVAAFDHVKQRANASQLNRFKQNSLFGVEQDSGIAALAVVNMIFRGDGKNNIIEGNCFAKFLASSTKDGVPTAEYVTTQPNNPPVTKVMMNPPFALKRSDEKEYRFIDLALKEICHGGLLFSVVPYSALVRPGKYLAWRKHSLLANNTLLAVVSFPSDLFYPVGVTTAGIFLKKGIPHPPEQNVLWVRAKTDGLLISKGKRLPSERTTNALRDAEDILRAFIHNPNHPIPNVNQFVKASPLNTDDNALDLAPEAYLDQAEPSDKEITLGLEESVRQTLAYLVKIDRAVLAPELLGPQPSLRVRAAGWKPLKVAEVFDLHRGDFHAIDHLDPGIYPTISRIGTDNGFVGFFDKPEDAVVWEPGTITVSSVSGDAFLQPVPSIATDNVVLCKPRHEYRFITPTALFFLQFMINQVKWRFSCGRQCYKTKSATTELMVPVTKQGAIDWDYMDTAVRSTRYWPFIEAVLSTHGEGSSTLKA